MPPISWTPKFATQPPQAKYCVLSYPAPDILLVRLNRPKQLNSINADGHDELDEIWKWLDKEPTLSVGIVTGTGRAFCAGADLKGTYHTTISPSTAYPLNRLSSEWNKQNSEAKPRSMSSSGFGGLSRRGGRKPVIAAVNGICFGGGCEMIVNCDLVVASSNAAFALPEVKRGVVAIQGALTRIVRTLGKPRAMEMALTGRTLTAEEAQEWGLINKVVGDKEGEVIDAAVEYAKMIAENSPDSVIVSREGIKLGWEGIGAEEGTRLLMENWYPRLLEGENIKEGVLAFVEKRKPKWKAAKL